MGLNKQIQGLNSLQWSRLEQHGSSVIHQTIWALLRFTGCRIKEARMLKVKTVYSDPSNRTVREEILFLSSISKRQNHPLSIPINHKLKIYLERYKPNLSGYLFPSPRDNRRPISYEAIYKYLKQKAEESGLSHCNVGTDSGRKSLIVALYKQGLSSKDIEKTLGVTRISILKETLKDDFPRKSAIMNSVGL